MNNKKIINSVKEKYRNLTESNFYKEVSSKKLRTKNKIKRKGNRKNNKTQKQTKKQKNNKNNKNKQRKNSPTDS
jgi:hypothetical protein